MPSRADHMRMASHMLAKSNQAINMRQPIT
jgi:hypothetical protein